MDSEILLGSEGLDSVSFVGGGKSPSMGDTHSDQEGTPWCVMIMFEDRRS